MPITPEFYDYEFDYLQTHKDLQESILRDITRRILKTDFVTDTAAWQAEKLQQSGMVFDDVLAEVGKRTDKMPKEVKKIFSDAETEVFNYDDELLIESGYNPKAIKHISPTMRRTITAALKKTCTEAVNLTKTTANTSQSLYISTCDLAHMQISSGAFTYQQAIANAIKHAAKQGVTVSYPSGHVSSLDVAVRRSVLTGVNQTAGKLQEMRSDEAGVDLMEITAHAGAREEHAAWQGKIVSKSGRKGYLSLMDIGYGSVTGFMGANCRHNWHMFFEGISKRAYTDEMLQEMNNHTVTYNGETMKEYDAIQMQRRYERGIRQSKQELVMLDEAIKNAPDDATKQQLQQEFEAAAVKLKGREARLADFTNQTGLRRDRYREQVFAVKTEKTIAGYGKSVSGKAVYHAQRHYDMWRKGIGAEDTPETLAKYYDMKYNDKVEYARLQKYALTIKNGESSPLLSYTEYRKCALQIESDLFGLKTSTGIVIKDYSAHFVCRTIGRSGVVIEEYTEGPAIVNVTASKAYKNKVEKVNRKGVSIEQIEDALLHGSMGKIQTSLNGEQSIVFIGQEAMVAVNPIDGSLIQTNPTVRS